MNLDIVVEDGVSPILVERSENERHLHLHSYWVRAEGYAVIDQEIELGLRSLAIPLYNSAGRVVAALNTGFAATQDGPETVVAEFLPPLLKVQAGLRRVLP